MIAWGLSVLCNLCHLTLQNQTCNVHDIHILYTGNMIRKTIHILVGPKTDSCGIPLLCNSIILTMMVITMPCIVDCRFPCHILGKFSRTSNDLE